MPRVKGSGNTGCVRSLRLPRELDAWFEERLIARPECSASELLLELVHGGLRLQHGYMRMHRTQLQALSASSDRRTAAIYLRALSDTFGVPYVEHLLRWLEADGIVIVGDNGKANSSV